MNIFKSLFRSVLISFFAITTPVYAGHPVLPEFKPSDFDGLFDNLPTKESSVAKCDRLAAHKWDPNATAPGVTWEAMDGQAAVFACKRAADFDGDNMRIIYQLGRAYDKQGDERALRLMDLAGANFKYPAALYHLAAFYEDGLYTKKDLQRAYGYYNEGAARGHVPSLYEVGRLRYKYGKSQSEKLKAIAEIQRAAELGVVRAQSQISELILSGKVAGKEPKDAVAFLYKAQRTSGAASYRLHGLYRDGDVVQADPQMATFFLQRAAKLGHKQAKQDLAAE